MKQINTLLVTLPSLAEMGRGKAIRPFAHLKSPLWDLGVKK